MTVTGGAAVLSAAPPITSHLSICQHEGNRFMRFMLIVKSDTKTEAGEPLNDELVAALDKYNDELVTAGAFLSAEGLQPSAKGARLKLVDDQRILTRGPFGNPEKLVAGYWIINADSNDDAIAWAKRAPFETSQIEIRQVFEPWDQAGSEEESEADGSVPSPANGGGTSLKRFFCISNPSAESEAGIPPSPEMIAAMNDYIGQMAASGAFLGGDGLMPSALGARVTFSGKNRTVTDGPFIETTELIGGFALIQAKSLDEVIDSSWEFLNVGNRTPGEERACEIREIFDFPTERPESR